jgi:hypothetical protein
MKERYCFWSAATGPRARLLPSLLLSARRVGVFKDFHFWTDRQIPEAKTHAASKLNGPDGLFQLALLEEEVCRLRYDYYVWLSPDNFFVRHPGNVLDVLAGAPVHATFEGDVLATKNRAENWEGCSLKNIATLMRFCGVHNRSIFTASSGFWIVHREAVEALCNLARSFGELAAKAGYPLGIEPRLAYAAQMLSGNPYRHTLEETAETWAIDTAGHFTKRLPTGKSWHHVEPLSEKKSRVNPAIARLPHAHQALLAKARQATA